MVDKIEQKEVKEFPLKYKIIILILVVGFSGYIFIKSLGGNYNSETGVVSVINYTNTSLITGEVQADKDAELSFEKGGIVKTIYVDDGEYVNKGDNIASLDVVNLQSELREHEALLEEENIKLEKLERGLSEQEKISLMTSTETVKQELENQIDKTIATIYSISTAITLIVRNDIDKIFSNPRTKPSLNIDIRDSETRKLLVDGRIAIEEILGSFDEYTKFAQSITDTEIEKGSVEEVTNASIEVLVSLIEDAGVIHSSTNSFFDEVNKFENQAGGDGVYTLGIGETLKEISDVIDTLVNQKGDLVSALRNYENAKQEETTSLTIDSKEIDAQRARVRATRERVIRFTKEIEDSILSAPFSGTVSGIDIKEGQRISSETHALRISDDKGSLYIKANASQNDIQYLKEGDEVEIVVDAFNLKTKGVIRSVNAVEIVVNGTTVYAVFIDFEEEKLKI